ncbi:MAG: class I SAM-dependent methyltransferase [Myxococcota bacterium]
MTPAPGCPVCGAPDPRRVVSLPRIPALCNRLHPSREAARAAETAAMDLRMCAGCGHLFNAAFDPRRVAYGPGYENSLHCSGRFTAYAERLADRLVTEHGIRGKRVAEIGCGDGAFLQLLCARGNNRGVGFDPSHAGAATSSEAVTIVQQTASEAFLREAAPEAVICRHVLEHIDTPVRFLEEVRRGCRASPDPLFFFEVPNALFLLRGDGIWDLIYEHCGHFTPASLRRAFAEAGIRVDVLEEAYAGQFLTVLGRPGAPASRPACASTSGELLAHAKAFARRYRDATRGWADRLRRWHAAGMEVVVWGAGSKGITFVNGVPGAEAISALVDINPRKHGKHVPGTGHPVRAPEELPARPPDVVLLMNPVYRDEVGSQLHALRLSPTLVDATAGAD